MARKKAPSSQTELDTFPLRLKELMTEEPKTSQQALADKIGVTRQAVSNYMLGQSSPDWKTLKAIADCFNVSADYLLGISNEKRRDMGLRAICDHTGLSADALDHLLFFKEHLDTITLNRFLISKWFVPFITSALRVSVSCQEAAELVHNADLDIDAAYAAADLSRVLSTTSNTRHELAEVSKNIRVNYFDMTEILSDIMEDVCKRREIERKITKAIDYFGQVSTDAYYEQTTGHPFKMSDTPKATGENE